LVPFLVLLAGVGQTSIFAEVGGISKLQQNWQELAQNWAELSELARTGRTDAEPADLIPSGVVYHESAFSCQIYENKGARFGDTLAEYNF
jgi:hypothetical protein